MPRIDKRTPFFAYAFLALCVALISYYLYLLPEDARWFATDEYWLFAKFRQEGVSALVDRITHWSPRPFSESLMYVYFLATEMAHSQLIIPFLLLCWTGLFAAITCRVFYQGQGRKLYRAVFALTLFCLFLEVGNMGHEVFYWPAATAAYLPTLSAIAVILFYSCRKNISLFNAYYVVILSIAATSSEVGAIFVAVFSVILFVWDAFSSSQPLSSRQYTYLAISFLIAVAVLIAMATYRLGGGELVLNAANIHQLNSVNALKTLMMEWIDPTEQIQKWNIAEQSPLTTSSIAFFVFLGLAGKCLYFIGVRQCSRHIYPDCTQSHLWMVFAVSLIITCYVFILLAYYQFGGTVGICCHRYNEIRQCFYILIITSIAMGYRHIPILDNINISIALIFLAAALVANMAVNLGFGV